MKRVGMRIVRWSVNHPVWATTLMMGTTILLAVLAGLPIIWQGARKVLPMVTVDTDPENMLSSEEPVRLFHNRMKAEFNLYDMVVVGVANDTHPEGVFNVQTLAKVKKLTDAIQGEMRWVDEKHPEDGEMIVPLEVIAPSTVDNIEAVGDIAQFNKLMRQSPQTEAQALTVRDQASRIPFLKGTLVSEDGKALAIYVPLTEKHYAHEVAERLKQKIAELGEGDDHFYITGLPVAEDTFGVEMFKQMAISAPVAMGVIFILMWVFFRKIELIVPPLILAGVTAVGTMALLVVTGNTIHIMSSMIPIFIMPIAVLDAIHIISDFFDRYGRSGDRKQTIEAVMDELFMPMLFTSLTTTAGFASLALTPIPPVQVFGLFVAIGVMSAWLWTIMFIPAAIMFVPERRLASLAGTGSHEEPTGWMARMLDKLGQFTYHRSGVILAVTAVAVGVAAWGITRININDNPTKWFEPGHPIRVADRVLNAHFGGTYMAYLQMQAGGAGDESVADFAAQLEHKFDQGIATVHNAPEIEVLKKLKAELAEMSTDAASTDTLVNQLYDWASDQQYAASDADYPHWDVAIAALNEEKIRKQVFKNPQVLRYVMGLQDFLLTIRDDQGKPIVGKSNSLADMVATVNRVLQGGADAEYRIPDSALGVGQCLSQYENSNRPRDIDHFVVRDDAHPEVNFRQMSMWCQLRSGDNRDMSRVVAAVEGYFRDNPPPAALTHEWFGLTYINVIWQEKMVAGMMESFLGSFLVVLIMMVVLFRSALWGILSMIPLTVTVGLIYGLIGIIGKDYDMPVAVLSSLSLGLAVDYAIHFLARTRESVGEFGSWKAAIGRMFGEPATAITRNAIVVGIGFAPLLLAPLVPYQTVGVFIALILLMAGAATLFILPALVKLLENALFPKTKTMAMTCRVGTNVLLVVSAVLLVAINLHQFFDIHWAPLVLTGSAVAAVGIVTGWAMSRRKACRIYPAIREGEAS